ncbi:response regulator [Paenibacillus rigui]|nr:response regulator [Paenibacillus rigui]
MWEQELRMCVIDDIKTIVNGIVNHIPWEEHGIRIVGTASNGEDGIELIRSTRPHIILSDIRMPKLDGLEMTRAIVKQGDLTKIVFLSGYTDFDYAQQAIRLGAFDFIQKPFTPSQILEVVLKAKKAIEQELLEVRRMNEMESKIRESMPFLRQEYFRLLMRYPTSPLSASQRWDFLQIPLAKHHFTVMLVEIDHFMERSQALPVSEVELIRFSIQNIMEETIATYTTGFVFREDVHQFAAILNPSLEEKAEWIAEKCRENIGKYTRHTVSIGLGGEVEEVHEISRSYQQAMTALSYNFYTGGDSVYSFSNVPEHGGLTPRYSADKEKELLYCIRLGNEEKAMQSLDEFFDEGQAVAVPPDPEAVRAVYYELTFLINRVLAEKIPPADMAEMEALLLDMKNDPSLSLRELQEQLKQLCRLGCEKIRRQQSKEASQQVDEVIAYIREHLDLNLTIGEYAKMVYLSASYFSNLFKKVTGMTVTQFVTTERMERAKEMLTQGMQVQEISLALGYEDRPYFTELFKRHTGMTPSEFRQLYGGPK